MITRREVVTGGVFTGVLGAGTRPSASVPATEIDERMVKLLGEIRDELKGQRPNCNANDCPEIERIRAEQRTFLKGRTKFPDFLDIGADIWDRVCDWHVERQFPLQVTRLADGRYALPFFQTMLVLRPEIGNTFVGTGYDR